jgi:hypothetical protein
LKYIETLQKFFFKEARFQMTSTSSPQVVAEFPGMMKETKPPPEQVQRFHRNMLMSTAEILVARQGGLINTHKQTKPQEMASRIAW